ncbi:MAG: DUF1080 domain-containing protein [Flavobacteriaceae bacterium]|nr:DUF1080 domain-containing protein [Flavobacteriaceae bacterium]
MKTIIITLSVFLLVLCTTTDAVAQINRTLETKVADILAQLPTKNLAHSDKLMQQIINLKSEGVLQFCDMLVPPGAGNDTKARFAIESVAIYSGGRENTINNSVVEDALLKAIEKASNPQIRAFLIRRLIHCGTNASVTALSTYLSDNELYKPALASLTSIGTLGASKAIFDAIKSTNIKIQSNLIDALGKLRYLPAVEVINKFSSSDNHEEKKSSLMALAEISSEISHTTLYNAAKRSNFNLDDSKAIIAYIHYGKRLSEEGNKALSSEVAENLLENCNSKNQLHYRSAAIHLLRENKGEAITKTLIKEAKNSNKNYRGAVLSTAAQNLSSSEVLKWVKGYKRASSEAKPQIMSMLSKRTEPKVYKCIVSSLKSKDLGVRTAGIKALAFQDKIKSIPLLLESLKQASSSKELKAIEGTLLRISNSDDSNLLAQSINNTNDEGKIVLINVLGARSSKSQFNTLTSLLGSSSDKVKSSIYTALPKLSTDKNLPKLIGLLGTVKNKENIANIQNSIIGALDNSDKDYSKIILDSYNTIEQKGKILSLLPALNTGEALQLVLKSLNSDNSNEKLSALKSLANWRNNDALPYLFKIATDSNNELQSNAFKNYLSQVGKSSYPDDQKLLLIKKLLPFSKNIEEKKQIISQARNIKTFLSLIFVSKYLDIKELTATASNTAIRIALPAPGKNNGLSGEVVKTIISKSINNITGSDSQYIKIDVKEFLDNMSKEKGFISIFNGKDFTGWEGLVENPIKRGEMHKITLARAQTKANKQMMLDWFIKDGVIGFKGEGYNNICTIKDYGDFEMLVDWKITKGGDSGIYLRGTPQVQIWDIARIKKGAQVGSGGLYNNKTNKSIPLVVADNAIDEWNTFRIKMVGERVTVHLNGVLVTNNVILENFWDRKLPIFAKEAIELQAHGKDLGFKNIYIREINSGNELLSDEERKAGFKSLFNGKDLDHWIGNKTDYIVENNEIAVRPEEGGHGNLYTAEEYSDFIFRFEFKLTPGANNGLGIRTPLEGDAAYVGTELQILDNTASIYAKLKNYQYHGSAYGIIAAKKGFLNPVGEWNYQEIIIKGDDIKIILNKTVILEGNLKEASKNGTVDYKDHPGLKRNKGHIAFLGHGSELEFRNIRIKDLSK